MSNPYEDYLNRLQDQQQRQKQDLLQSSVGDAALVSPNDFAEQVKLSKAAKISVEAVDAYKPEAKRAKLLGEAGVGSLWKESPKTAEWLTEPTNAKLSSDAISHLKGIEDIFKNVGSSIMSGLYGASSGTVGVARAITESANKYGARPIYQILTGKPGEEQDKISKFLGEYQKSIDVSAEQAQVKDDKFGIYGGISSLAQNLAMIPTMVIGGEGLGLAHMASVAGGQEYGKARAAGKDVGQSLVYGVSQGMIEAATEKIPIHRLLGDLKAGTPLYKTLFRQLASEIPGEQAATVLQDLNEWATINPDKPFSEYVKERPSAFVQTLGATIVGSLGMTGITSGVHHTVSRIVKAEQAHRDATFIENLTNISADNPLRPRSNDTFENFIVHQAKGTPVENIYVDANEFSTLLNQSGISKEEFAITMPEVAADLENAVATGGDVVIPTAQYAARIAGSPLGESMKPFIRLDPEGISLNDAKEVQKQQEEMMSKAAELLVDDGHTNRNFISSAHEVEGIIADQLKESGTYTPEQNRRAGAFVRDFYVAKAAELGVTPKELYDMFPYKIGRMGEQQPMTVADVLGRNVSRETETENQNNYLGNEQPAAGSTEQPTGESGATAELGYPDVLRKATEVGRIRAEFRRGQPEISEDDIAGYAKQGNEIVGDIDRIATEISGKPATEGGVKLTAAAYELGDRFVGDKEILKSAIEKVKESQSIADGLIASGDYQAAMNAAFKQQFWTEFAQAVAGRKGELFISDFTPEFIDNLTVGQENLFSQQGKGDTFYSALGRAFENAKSEFMPGSQWDAWLKSNSGKLGVKASEIEWTGISDWLKLKGKDKVTKQEIADYLKQNGIRVQEVMKVSDTKYSNYQEPGGQNYRELLLTFPTVDSEKVARRSELAAIDRERPLTIEEQKEFDSLKPFAGGSKSFKSSHWDELNILAHVRFNDRTDAQGKKVLFIEEVQSDWGQKGKKEGFNKIPSAPFVTDTKAWTSLAVKRMIRYAAENGYDKVAFINGEQSAARYDLSKQVSELAYWKDGDRWGVSLLDDNGRPLDGWNPNEGLTEKDLEANLGKEIAQKIVNDEGDKNPETSGYHDKKGKLDEGVSVIQQDGLKVGGEGMKAFYDKIVPQTVNDIIKKWGGKLETSKIAENDQLSFTVTPEMKKSVMEGQPLFQKGDNGARGGFDPQRLTTLLNEKSDFSTFLHETGHFFLEMHSRMTDMPQATPQMKADFQTLLDWFGVKDKAAWDAMTTDEQRPYHEQFAYNFEKYLFEGKAPSAELHPIFARFRDWLMRVYKSIAEELNDAYKRENGKDLPILTGEVKQVMDRMLATDAQIKEAEQIRAMIPVFQDQALSGMDDAQWAAYKALHQEAHDQAVTDLSKDTMRQMKWLSNARSRVLKEMQTSTKQIRDKIMEEVQTKMNDEPVYKAINGIRESDIKLSEDQVKAVEGVDISKFGRGKYSLTSKEGGMPIDVAADLYGFNSGAELVKAISEAKPFKDALVERTDARMMAEHSDLLDPRLQQLAVDEALHNEARARFVATELRYQSKAATPVRVIMEAAKQAAKQMIDAKKVSEIRVKDYTAAESRAAKEAEAAMRKGDSAAAVKAKQNQLLNHALAKQAIDAQREIDKGIAYVKRFDKASVRDKIDVDILDQIDDLLSRFDFRRTSQKEPNLKLRQLSDWVQAQIDAGYMPQIPEEIQNSQNRTRYSDMTLQGFRSVIDSMKSMEAVGKERNKVTIEGEKRDLNEYVNTVLIPKIQERGKRFSTEELYTKPEDRQLPAWKVGLDHFSSFLRSFKAQLKPQEYKRNFYDRHDLLGPFGQAIFEPIMNRNYYKIDQLKALSDEFKAMSEKLGSEWQNSLTNSVTNDVLIDKIATQESGNPVYMKFTRGRLLMLALHSGNESNFSKLTKGYGWAPADVLQFLGKNLTAKDIEAVNEIWKLNEKHWPDITAMYHRLGQTIPEKIPARPLDLPNGKLTGGYAHIDYDPLRSKYGEKAGDRAAKEIADNGTTVGDYFRRKGTTNGAMNARVEGYSDMIDLDYHTIERAIKESVHDLAYREVLVDVNKILSHPDFRREFMQAYGREQLAELHTWLGRLANSNNVDRDTNSLLKVLQYTRTGIVMNGIALRASTVVKHGGSAGVKTIGYFAGGGEKYLASRAASMVSDYKNQIKDAQEKFPEIRARLMQQDRDYRAIASHLFEQDGKLERAERFGHAAVAWGDMISAVPTAWAAYDWAVTEGIPEKLGGTGKPMTEEQAINFANKMVREAHGSTIESARSNILNSPSEAVKMFTTLYGFMNNTYGQMADVISKLDTANFGKPEILARSFAAIIVPALVAGLVKWKDDEEHVALWAAESIAEEMAGSVAYLRDAVHMLMEYSHAGQVPAESWMQSIVAPIVDAKKIAQGKSAPIVQDVANAVGVGLHIPGLGQIGKVGQYLEDVRGGRKKLESAGDVKRMIVGGK